MEETPINRKGKARKRKQKTRLVLTPSGFIVLLLINLLFLAILTWFFFGAKIVGVLKVIVPEFADLTPAYVVGETATPTLNPTSLPSWTPQSTLTPVATLSPTMENAKKESEVMYQALALQSAQGTNLFLTNLLSASDERAEIIQLTSGDWHDTYPSYNRENNQIAFASNRDNGWNIYVLDIESGGIAQITNDLFYQGRPSWSPDGKWIVYGSYETGNLEIFVSTVEGNEIIQITDSPGADHSPAWSPNGREIAYISTIDRQTELWIVDLDEDAENRYRKIKTRGNHPQFPSWSADGSYLAWSALNQDNMRMIFTLDMNDPQAIAENIGQGSFPIWGEDNEIIISILNMPSQSFISLLDPDREALVGLLPLQGEVRGLAWIGLLSEENQIFDTQSEIGFNSESVELPGNTSQDERLKLGGLTGINAPHPELNESIIEKFNLLRKVTGEITGWDYLVDLDNAFVPINEPLPYGLIEDWSYTGRAISTYTTPLSAGWISVVREDFVGEIYWRLFLKCLAQDGTCGEPMHDLPWDLLSRASGDLTAFEEGGKWASTIPEGYWVEFTSIAHTLGWERVPSLTSWRHFYDGIRYNQFVYRDGLNWNDAMLEIYPIELLQSLELVP